ncbi:hypothetical protein A3C09_03830 [Candidatus Uhrbacteria bacterium RIFCSPHIGHO2_02_FULL_47_44]|uniref:Uncharacterized protein n=1 Tax=Candidatus Uhrbacteria bacterium RIFCSPLOWO2_02_FULL_48_18 TaxID=1802408 RepID=A0A1F7VCG4_9BACT|nr:MAG: hypothetical protein A2839_00690 [Candidatus Uhrbacteria bacterium RIFCSPHIGHO2_01_FULL_47_10]OGL71808.1 MAG: hypothetical protein A3C09_03830 [Candidatus Uhrbacteria bacterium RIFCSPHIGHO2_02_FULL_47_44]OGL80618.1 MAG: hypothetical protein A3B20_04455 [Candidatus Uhrbacteria bacterium RIFCSPLOWO2_01_FULL_47_17]OGL88199.1 MAG: hypothetical protein A3I41_00525 [Candidatus Uhrbacteria bacterium RIFCSPLOWO2_02_FULL_48_18]
METVIKWFPAACFFLLVLVMLFITAHVGMWMWPGMIKTWHGVAYVVTHPAEVVVGLLIAFCLLANALK